MIPLPAPSLPMKTRKSPASLRAREATARYAVPALDKGLDILELLARESDGLTLKLFDLAHRHKPIKSLTAAAAPLMRDLAQRSLQSCHLAVFYAGRVLVVGEIDSPERWAFGLKVGAQVGLTDTASGYVLLAFQDEAGRRAMLASHQEVEGELEVKRRQLSTTVQDVARSGYAQLQSRQIRGVTNIAFPVLATVGHAIAALNIPYIERIDKKITPSIAAVKEMLRKTAAALSLLMGHVEDATSK